MMKKKFHYSSTVVALTALVGLLGPSMSHAAQCASVADSALFCGSVGFYNTGMSCGMQGPDIVSDPSINGGAQIRVLGGQICSAVGSDDSAGNYTTNVGGSNPQTPYPGTKPYGWNYIKNSDALSMGFSVTPSQVPPGEFMDPAWPYVIERVFPGAQVNVAFPPPDDAATVSIGSYSVGYGGACLMDYSSVFGPPCTYFGSPGGNVNPGDPISYKVVSAYRPNNGSALWGSGKVGVAFTVTYCETANHLQQMGGYTDIVDYHPIADDTCAPAAPAINGTFQGSGSNNITITVPVGQTQTVNFDYTNAGQPHSKAINVVCNGGVAPAGIGVSGVQCPQNSISN